MLRKFKDFIGHHSLFDPGDRILLAVSSGLDSMVMLELFRQAGYSIGVAHANFQLRGGESDGDEGCIRQYCDHAGIPFSCKSFEVKNYAKETGLSIQMAARELRYEWFGRVMEQEKYHWLSTAHHLNDNIETVLLRWTAGAGIDQLAGIPLKNGKVVRPLLFATRAEILQYALSNKISWREDSSNATDDYQRNFIRHKVIPMLKEVNPSLEDTFTNSLEKMRGANELMQRGLGQLKDSITRTEGHQFLIDKNLLMLLQNPAFVCYEWLRPFGFEWDRCVQLISSIQSQPGKQFFSATHQALVDRENIIVCPRQEVLHEVLIEEGQDKVALGAWVLVLASSPGNRISGVENLAAFDMSKIKFPLLWRKWRDGDSFVPLGMAHRKKISDFLIDLKVPLHEKAAVTVLESGGEIMWVVGRRIDDRFKVTAKTKSILEIHVLHT